MAESKSVYKSKDTRSYCSTDLLQAAEYHLQFLADIEKDTAVKSAESIRRAIYRYEIFWLPLAAENNKRCLPAPLDVEWVWHCHMLCPSAYGHDCLSVSGALVDHKLYSSKERKHLLKQSEKTWTKKYPTVPFLVDDLFQCPSDYESKLTYDILASSGRQSAFYYQISLPHYRDKAFLKDAEVRYRKFLFLKKQYPEEFLVPCYDIDLMWHTHQLHPCSYKHDTERLLGWLLNHDDTVNDRTPGSKLCDGNVRTRELWKQTFGECFPKQGAMFRGDPPYSLYKLVQSDIWLVSTRQSDLTLHEIDVSRKDGYRQRTIHLMLKIFELVDVGTKDCALKVNGPATTLTLTETDNMSFTVNSGPDFFLKIMLHEQIRTGYKRYDETIGQSEVNLDFAVLDEEQHERGGSFSITCPLSGTLSNFTCSMSGTCSSPSPHSVLLKLQPGLFEVANMPTHVDQIWGPIPIIGHHHRHDCMVASHKLLNHKNVAHFTARVIHSLTLMTSVVQIYFHDKMAAVGHVIELDQLPLPEQLKYPAVSMSPEHGERAMLVKGPRGDAYILIAFWEGFKKGRPSGSRGKLGYPGHLMVNVVKLGQNQPRQDTIVISKHSQIFTHDGMRVDLRKGQIKIQALDCIPECIALAFSVSILYVLCVPRPSMWQPGQSLKPGKEYRGALRIESMASEDMVMVLASGLMFQTPSNHYLRHTYGTTGCGMYGGSSEGSLYHDLDPDKHGAVVDTDAGTGCGGCGGCGAIAVPSNTGGCASCVTSAATYSQDISPLYDGEMW